MKNAPKNSNLIILFVLNLMCSATMFAANPTPPPPTPPPPPGLPIDNGIVVLIGVAILYGWYITKNRFKSATK